MMKDRILKLYEDGYSFEEIKKKEKLNTSELMSCLKSIDPSLINTHKENLKKRVLMYKKTTNESLIAQRMCLSIHTIYQYSKGDAACECS